MDQKVAERASRREIYIQAGVQIEDPTALPGLVTRVSPDAVPVSGIPFDTRDTTGRLVDCALCGRRENHYRGFVVSFEDATSIALLAWLGSQGTTGVRIEATIAHLAAWFLRNRSPSVRQRFALERVYAEMEARIASGLAEAA